VLDKEDAPVKSVPSFQDEGGRTYKKRPEYSSEEDIYCKQEKVAKP